MASITNEDFMFLWTQNDAQSLLLMQQFLLAGLDEHVQRGSDTLKLIKVGEPATHPVVRWGDEYGYPHAITGQLSTTTLTFSGNLFGAAITQDAIERVIRVGTILERESTKTQVKVTSVSGIADGTAPWACTVALHGNSTALSDDLAPVEWRILNELWTDFRDADHARALPRRTRQVGTQIHAETFEIAKSRKNTKYHFVPDETEHQISALLQKMRRSLAYSVFRARPVWSGSAYVYGDTVEESSMCGLTTWPELLQAEEANTNVYVNASGAEIDKAYLNNLVKNMWLTEHADFGVGDWRIICHPTQAEFMADFDISYRQKTEDSRTAGFMVDVFQSKIGKSFPIVSDQYMRPNEVLVADLSKVSYGYYAQDELERKELPSSGRYQRWMISFQTYGTVLRNARQSLGMIYGLATS